MSGWRGSRVAAQLHEKASAAQPAASLHAQSESCKLCAAAPSAAARPPPPPQCAQRRTRCAYWRSRRPQRAASTAAASWGWAVQRSHSGLVAWVSSSHTAQWRDR